MVSIDAFKVFKSRGPNGIFPTFPQKAKATQDKLCSPRSCPGSLKGM